VKTTITSWARYSTHGLSPRTITTEVNSLIILVQEEHKDDKKIEDLEEKNKHHQTYPNKMRPGLPTSRDLMECSIIKNLISSYYHVVKKNINDLVPKTIMCFLVNQSKLMAEKEMVSQLYKSGELEALLQEDPFIAKKRKTCKDSLTHLKKSLDILTAFNELANDS
jgi:hypothetical protein